MKKIIKQIPETYIGHNLKKLRLKAKLTLDDVAFNTGISKAYLSQLEHKQSKKPSIETVVILAKAFGVYLEAFVLHKL